MHLTEIARRTPDKPAVVMADGTRALSFAELDRSSLALARVLHGRGLRVGDHVAVLMHNRPEFLLAIWAAQRSGLYWTPVNHHLTEAEAGYIVGDCGARVLFASDVTAGLAHRLLERLPAPPELVVLGEVVGECVDPSSEPEEVEGASFFYSSGTTGLPKGIRRAHSFPPFGAGRSIDHVMHRDFGFAEPTVYLSPAPLYHAAPISWSLGTQRNGGTVVLMDRFDPRACLDAIERHRVTHVQFVPTHMVRLLKLPPQVRAGADVSSLQVVVHGAAPCPPEVKRGMIDWLGPVLFEYYSGSEAAGLTTITSEEWLARPGSVGRASQGVIHVLGEDGRELPTGEVGTVYFEGGPGFVYHNDPDKTAGAINDLGWATLGDLGHLDADGYLYLSDRRTDLIVSDTPGAWMSSCGVFIAV